MKYVHYCYHADNFKTPQSFKEAVSSPEAEHWKVAMDNEMLKLNDTYVDTELPLDKSVVGGKMGL